MNKEQERLLNMRKENKISESDYQMLASALNKKSLCTNIENSIFINPFQKIAGLKALILGLILMVLMSLLGVYTDVYFDGVLGYFIAGGLKTAVKPSFLLLLYQNIVACLTLTCLFLMATLILRQKRIRIIDFFGTVSLARYPIFISLIFTMLEKYLRPEFFKHNYSEGIELHLSLIGTVSNLIFLTCFIWQIMTYFSALKEASGLRGKQLWVSFIVVMILAEVIGMILTRFFLYS